MSMMTLDPNVPTQYLRDYYKTNSGVCLVCGNENIVSVPPRVKPDGDIYVKVGCKDCDALWYETYTMSALKMQV